VVKISDRTPALGDQTLLRNINIEQIESMINGLDFARFRHPHSNILCGCNQNTMSMILSLAQNSLQIFNSGHNSNRHFSTLLRRIWTWIESSAKSFTNLLDTRLKLFALEKDDENALVDRDSGMSVNQRFGNFGLSKKDVATASTPK
jgi:hypothetical protein